LYASNRSKPAIPIEKEIRQSSIRFWPRLLALSIDGSQVLLNLGILTAIKSIFGNGVSLSGYELALYALVLFLLLGHVSALAAYEAFTGQSLGKKVMGLNVHSTKETTRLSQYLFRFFLKYVSFYSPFIVYPYWNLFRNTPTWLDWMWAFRSSSDFWFLIQQWAFVYDYSYLVAGMMIGFLYVLVSALGTIWLGKALHDWLADTGVFRWSDLESQEFERHDWESTKG
jgi:uncharacterized RDD family membrane protein YckC